MTPGARLQAAIDVLQRAMAGDTPADRVLVDWGRSHRFAGSKDRAAIADIVYRCLRQWRSLGWALSQVGTLPARAAVLGAAFTDGGDLDTLCQGPHAPPPLAEPECLALMAPPLPLPDPVRLDYPDWLDGPLRASLGAAFEPALLALRERAPVDLRVNTLKASREAAAAALAAEGIDTAPVALCPTALRARPGAPIARSRAYAEGLVELQDAASQAAAALAAARPGETVLDFCAGGGGKTLALAAAMEGRGRVIAHDVDPRRLRDLPARAARAGARIELATPSGLSALVGRCDLVFVDAPCSGSGSWRRDPWGKWRLTVERLETVMALQAQVLRDAARFLAPEGRLAYATCSLLDQENDQGERFVGRPPAARLRLTPADGCDGFFCAVW